MCSWSKQHEALEKLNMQAVMNANQQTDEFVKEYLVSYEKVQLSLCVVAVVSSVKYTHRYTHICSDELPLNLAGCLAVTLYSELTSQHAYMHTHIQYTTPSIALAPHY